VSIVSYTGGWRILNCFRYHPELLSTLRKWSAKIQAVTPSNLMPSSRNTFRNSKNAQLKPITEVIQEALGDHSKALARTQTRRGEPRMGGTGKPHLDVEGKPLKEEDGELFDDTDFYQQLLRDVIDGKTTGGRAHSRVMLSLISY
jgi:protein AATF/BFR2